MWPHCPTGAGPPNVVFEYAFVVFTNHRYCPPIKPKIQCVAINDYLLIGDS
jgi:hypothetical protein